MSFLFRPKERALSVYITNDECGAIAQDVLNALSEVYAKRQMQVTHSVKQVGFSFEDMLESKPVYDEGVKSILKSLETRSFPVLLLDGKVLQPGGFLSFYTLFKSLSLRDEELRTVLALVEKGREYQAKAMKKFLVQQAQKKLASLAAQEVNVP
jgi:hypothetical protein